MSKSQETITKIFENEKRLKEMAADSSFARAVPQYYPGGMGGRPMEEYPRMFTPTTKAAIWGPADALTMSLLKTDIFDRRYYVAKKPFTMDDVIEAAFSEKNRDFNDMPLAGMTRPPFGTLVKEGGRYDHQKWSELYPFPCQKPVGQIIVKSPDMKGAAQPDAVQFMKNGATKVDVEKGGKKLNVEYVMGMKRNVIGIDAEYQNLEEPISFRLYRHQDQGHRRYMDENDNYIKAIVYHPADPAEKVKFYDFEADKDINGKFGPPESGNDGRFFWIKQTFPKEPTFPQGFQYVMMGLVSEAESEIEHFELQKGLGTAPGVPRDTEGHMLVTGINTATHPEMYERMDLGYSYVRNAPGVAENAKLKTAGSGRARLYVAIVTLSETEDYFEEAKRMLLEAEKLGFEGLSKENESWYDALYEKRENGRIVMHSEGEKERTDRLILEEVYKSWSVHHGGFCSPDPAKLEGSAGYAAYDVDTQSWHSLPCYNELFTEGRYFTRNQFEPKLQWPKLITHYHETLKKKARELYGLPGMMIAHGYLPPAKQHPWYVENECLDYTMDVPGQVMKVIWNVWDYTGDEEYLKETAYPLLRDLAIFYEAFARRNYNGKYYELMPVVETESYGISYRLKYTKNTTAALTMLKKTLNIAVEAAEYLGEDADLIPGWREVADNLQPYPKFMVGMGEILGGNAGIIPRFTRGDHGIFTGVYPATLADEINLDSSREDKELIIRTADTVRATHSFESYILVGSCKDYVPCNYNTEAIKIDDYDLLAQEVIKSPERLLNSRSGRIHLFPVVPGWTDAAFNNFLARGGFMVSAAKDKNGVTAVTVEANRSIPCSVMNPWKGKDVVVTNTETGGKVAHAIDTSNGECIVFDAVKGCKYSIDAA